MHRYSTTIHDDAMGERADPCRAASSSIRPVATTDAINASGCAGADSARPLNDSNFGFPKPKWLRRGEYDTAATTSRGGVAARHVRSVGSACGLQDKADPVT